ncbi:hypothetical protein KP509_01G016100 [Ceratopteris richardii]|uniref:ATP synthase subunit e, mitochondrial n=1 Tax=Ceratopteris richardii TaxID=49495 RepID=A0A8T2VIE1_CERRI|nr:hypothetical protein KP509_01G016100 [Ceratopteris richardii]
MAYPGLYSGKSTFAQVARVSAAVLGFTYGAIKLRYLKAVSKAEQKAAAKAHH